MFKDDDWRFSTKVESQYLAQLYATIGIRASDAAQQLLGKAKSLKSVGGLEQFVREFMLDEPSSLTRLPDALKQIDPLVDARELLAVAQRKRKILGDIEKIQQRYGSESSDLGIIDLVDQPMVRAYTDHVRLAQCPAQIDSLDATIDQLGNEYEDVTRQLNLAKAEGDSLNAQISGSSASSRAAAVAGGRRRGTGRGGLAPPRRLRVDDHRAATSTSRTPPTSSGICARNSATRPPNCWPSSTAAGKPPPTPSTRRRSARIARDDAAKELNRVEHVGSALPEFAITMREHICAAVGVDPASCPTSPS